MFLLVTALSVAFVTTCTPSSQNNANGTTYKSEKQYAKILQHYGYLEEEKAKKRFSGEANDKQFSAAIKKFQIANNLNVTARLDEATKRRLESPRCGNKDYYWDISRDNKTNHLRGVQNRRTRFDAGTAKHDCTWPFEMTPDKYELPGQCAMYDPLKPFCSHTPIVTSTSQISRCNWWQKHQLTWRLLNYPTNGPSERRTERAFRRAAGYWSAVANLQFVKVSETDDNADLTFSFQPTGHVATAGDIDDSDFAYKELGHASLPSVGWMHLNDDLNWVIGVKVPSIEGHNLQYIIIHELGHVLGLLHSNDPQSIMQAGYPYDGWHVSHGAFQFSDDDIAGIQELYGPNPDNPHRVYNV